MVPTINISRYNLLQLLLFFDEIAFGSITTK